MPGQPFSRSGSSGEAQYNLLARSRWPEGQMSEKRTCIATQAHKERKTVREVATEMGIDNLDELLDRVDAHITQIHCHDGRRLRIVGHSLGGTAVLAAAARIPESTAVATIGAPASSRA